MAPAAPTGKPSTRNAFLDLVRSVALIRIIVWHSYGYAWISYFIASMPAMFFVAGSLMATSLRRGNALDVLLRRFKRILLPLWVMAVVSIALMAGARALDPAVGGGLGIDRLIWWIFPLNDPRGSDWGMALWAPLWYLRCLTWLMLVSPALVFAWRKVGPALLVLPVAAFVAVEVMLSQGRAIPWQVHDFTLFGIFWLLGFSYADGAFSRIGTPVRVGVSAAAAVAAAAWAITQDVPGGVVNNSYPLHLFVGLAWLFGALALEQPLGRLAIRPRVARAVEWLSARAMSIYLWQSLGLLAMYQILWAQDYSTLTRDVLALPIVASVTFLAVLLFGWVEDIAGGRRPQLWPSSRGAAAEKGVPARSRPPALAGAVGLAGLAAVLFATGSVAQNPSELVQASANTVPPSGAGLHYRAQNAQIEEGPPVRSVTGRLEPVTNEELQAELEAWLADWNLPGATVTLRRESGEAWTGFAGVRSTGEPFQANEPYWIASVTKTFTAAMIMRLAEAGYVNLEDPVSLYVPDFPDAHRFTLRHLLQHTSGLVSGNEHPFEALEEAAVLGLQFEPGTGYMYSRAGYFLLGLVIEDVLGESYTQALHAELLSPLGLTSTAMDEELFPEPTSNHPYLFDTSDYENEVWRASGFYIERFSGQYDYRGMLWSSGGLWSTTSDLTRWALALWGSDIVLSLASRQEITTFLEADFDYTGIGTYPFCTCWREEGLLQAERWGFAGASGILEFDPVDRVALAVNVAGTLWDENVIDALEDISHRLRQVVRAREMWTDDYPSMPIGIFQIEPRLYVVEAGDTMFDIALRQGIEFDSIRDWINRTMELNGLDETAPLEVGQIIQLAD